MPPKKKMTKAEYEAYLDKRNAKRKGAVNVLFGSPKAWMRNNL